MSDVGRIDIDKDRVTVLLLINSLLIKKAHEIYVNILSNRSTIQQMPPQSRHVILEQYNNINRRLQCNLSVLSYLENLYNGNVTTQQPNKIEFPVILSPPPEMPELRQLYKRLQDLYPEAIEFLKIKMHQMKSQHESQAKTLPIPPNNQNITNSQIPHLQQQQMHQASQQVNSQIKHQPSQQQDPSQIHQRQQYPLQTFNPYGIAQNTTPSQFQSPQINMSQSRRTPSTTMASKIPVQHHLPQHHSKHLDMSFAGGISPQMMSKEPDKPAYNDPSNLLTIQNNMNKNVPSVSSISPQQILQQQVPPNDMSMEFL
ncbi:hypothetical protein JCM33374_g6376 [Metschnikowia sp. JCM 33374]|nr:hypothetical protein JCM33374_g6376 [Metschnikowia sp. JCM 33374]